MPGVLLIERGDVHFPRHAHVLHVPVRNQGRAVGVHVRHEHEDDFVANLAHFLSLFGDHLPRHPRRDLRRGHFRRVEAKINPHDRLAVTRQLARQRIGQRAATRIAVERE